MGRHAGSQKGSPLGKLDGAMSQEGTHPIDEHALGNDEAPEGVTLDRAAEIEAFLAVLTDEPRDQLLGRFDIDEERWGNARKVWIQRIEDEVKLAAAPGLRLPADEKYRLSMRYSIAYSKAAERAREEDADKTETVDPFATTTALGSGGVFRLVSSHG